MLSKSLAGATLEPLILTLLTDGPKYGFQLVHRAKQLYHDKVPWTNSKFYPILHRMEHDGWVESFWRESEDGPNRKYYCLTTQGQQELASLQNEWKLVNAMWQSLWGPEIAFE